MAAAVELVAAACLIWSLTVLVVQIIGVSAVFRNYSSPPPPSISSTLSRDAPSVTIIRPVKGLEPQLYECIASTCRQDYPPDKIAIRLCVDSRADPAYPVLKKVVADFPKLNVCVLVESDDPRLNGNEPDAGPLGPNPKIRNISRAYREAKAGDLVWIIDCNVWAGHGAMGRMVDKLMGFTRASGTTSVRRPYKFVHHLPIVTDLVDYTRAPDAQRERSGSGTDLPAGRPASSAVSSLLARLSRRAIDGGGRLDEMFMGTTHAKFYNAINTVGVAPCIVGKSNMFRKAHLDQVTNPARNPILPRHDDKNSTRRNPGVDYFSSNICEDHLIGDILWRSDLPGYANHGILWGDLVVQPMAGMSLSAYAARRVRWLRARKYTVLLATLVEPGVEPFLCCAYLSFALTTLPWFHDRLGVPQTWPAATAVWLLAATAWMLVDWNMFRRLHSGRSVEIDAATPAFARGLVNPSGGAGRPFREWLVTWLVRETMALPVWTAGVLLGSKVNWRGNEFYVRFDMSVVELKRGGKDAVAEGKGVVGKNRLD